MRVLLLTHSFNSLSQRLFVELEASGHEVSVEYDINDAVTEEAARLFKPDCLVAPFLKRAIPQNVWRSLPCFIVHPGVPGDRGPSALDWAILKGVPRWGVTVLQAEEEMDAGPVWASAEFPMREATKSSLYRNEVTGAAVAAVFETLGRFERGGYAPQYFSSGITPHPVPLPASSPWRACRSSVRIRKRMRMGEGTPSQRLRPDSLSHGERAGVRGVTFDHGRTVHPVSVMLAPTGGIAKWPKQR